MGTVGVGSCLFVLSKSAQAMVSVRAALLFTAIVCLAAPKASAYYFYVKEGHPKCFVEEVPAATLVVATYTSPDQAPGGRASNSHAGVRINVYNEEENLLEQMASAKGRFAFTSTVAGTHRLCFALNTSHWVGAGDKLRFGFQLQIGQKPVDYEKLTKREHLTSMELKVRKLKDQADSISHTQSYFRGREEMFRNTSESTNFRAQWWSLSQMFVLICLAGFQYSHLRKYFV